MFTGLIQHCTTIASIQTYQGGWRLTIDLGPLREGAQLGDSIAVNGICLTVREWQGTGEQTALFDVSSETGRATTIGAWQAGTAVNLEPALAVGDRLGGHLMSGHVDGVGRLVDRRPAGNEERFTFVVPDDGSVAVVEKGSVGIDGISLTSFNCQGARFSVAVVPHTWENTTLGVLRPGMRVNLEQDYIGRWVEKDDARGPLTDAQPCLGHIPPRSLAVLYHTNGLAADRRLGLHHQPVVLF